MKGKIKNCKHCNNEYTSENGNQSYCSDVCRQQAYYKRHNIVRPRNYMNVNTQFTPSNNIPVTDQNVNDIKPAPVQEVKPLIEGINKHINTDNIGAILEQMNKTHQAQMEAMETRLKLAFAQEKHEQEKQAKNEIIAKLRKEIQELENKSDINTSQLLGGLSNVFAGIDIQDLFKAKA